MQLDLDQPMVLAVAAGATLLLLLVLVVTVGRAGRRVTRATREATEEAHEREVLAARGDLAERTWSMVRTARRSLAEGRDLRDVYAEVDDLRVEIRGHMARYHYAGVGRFAQAVSELAGAFLVGAARCTAEADTHRATCGTMRTLCGSAEQAYANLGYWEGDVDAAERGTWRLMLGQLSAELAEALHAAAGHALDAQVPSLVRVPEWQQLTLDDVVQSQRAPVRQNA